MMTRGTAALAIGGLLEQMEDVRESKIPVLGDIPVIGQLFRSTDRTQMQREIIIFIAPHILSDSGRFEGRLLLQRYEEELRRTEEPADEQG